MYLLLQLFILLPLLGFVLSVFIPKKKEKILSNIAIGTVGLHLIGTIAFIGFWLLNSHPVLDSKHVTLYKNHDFEFFIDFYFDNITAVFAFVGSALVFLVALFSRTYMHRDEGFKRFFNTLLFFFTGYNLIIFSGNFETLFIGWEILGLCSFLLIAFYRDRYLPVKNGFKVISFYRFSDIALIVAMWLSHHLWHKNITFVEWLGADFLQDGMMHHGQSNLLVFTALAIVLAATIKSAQFPFSTWLPRAMEGPTTSSAIFYGSLAVHIGVFLLLRTSPLWENSLLIKGIIIGIGVLTSLIATTTARVQATVKTQIAYASITQIGLMFIEVAMGFHTLALVHFAGNAFLRTYQLLVSPSVLGYLVHDMFFNFVPKTTTTETSFMGKLKTTVYVLALKEWNLDGILRRYLWSPFKWLGNQLTFMTNKWTLISFGVLMLLGVVGIATNVEMSELMHGYLSIFFAFMAFLMILSAFSERGDALKAWLTVCASQLFIALSIVYNEPINPLEILIYLSGSSIAAVVGYLCLSKIKAIDNNIDLNQYHGYSYEKPKTAFYFLLAGLGVLGFPITPTFVGMDLLFTHIHANQVALIVIMALSFLFLELAILRIYCRVFLGQHKKADHPIAFKSS
jgi:NADH-quinone oxidoreductase subunit L